MEHLSFVNHCPECSTVYSNENIVIWKREPEYHQEYVGSGLYQTKQICYGNGYIKCLACGYIQLRYHWTFDEKNELWNDDDAWDDDGITNFLE